MVLLQGWLNVNRAKQKNDFATIWGIQKNCSLQQNIYIYIEG
jgi:hypothetical protein